MNPTSESTNEIIKPNVIRIPLTKQVIYKDREEELKRFEIEKNICVRLLKINNDTFVDIRRFFREYPTKKGIRISMEAFEQIKSVL